MNRFPDSVMALVSGLSVFDDILEELEEEYHPDAPTITVLMDDLGSTLVVRAGVLGTSGVIMVLDRLEAILLDGNEEEKDAAATGFLESVVSSIHKNPNERWVLAHLGKESRLYLKALDEFWRTEK